MKSALLAEAEAAVVANTAAGAEGAATDLVPELRSPLAAGFAFFMYVYIFTSPALKEIQTAIDHRSWAVEEVGEPEAWARLGRSRQMPIGAVGLFYCSSEAPVFTTPFIVESRPEDRAISGVWDQPRYLPFSIRPIGDLSTQVLFSHARVTWPSLKGSENILAVLNLSPALEFLATFIPRYDWDLILEQLGIDPETYEELFSAAPGIAAK